MKIVFFGSSKYSVISAAIIKDKLGLTLVVTNPDKPSGRQRQLTVSPVKQFAQKNKLALLETDQLDQRALETISDTEPDFLIVADYGKILPKSLLDLPKYTALNIHHSLLPKHRGPSPAPAAILAGEKISGVTIIKMTEEVDAGDILIQQEYELAPNETTDSLLIRLNKIGAELIVGLLPNLAHSRSVSRLHPRGEVETKPGEHPGGAPQDESQATYTHRFTKQDGFIDPEKPPDPQTFDRMVRAFYPWPGVWSKVILRQTQDDAERSRSIKVKSEKLILIKFLPGNLIQPEGKRPMSINEFMNGYPAVYEQIKHVFSQKAQS